MSLEQLCYVSSAQGLLSAQDLQAMLDSALRHNARNEITGLLLFSQGNFMQVLEGSPDALDETMGRIGQDRRHRDLMEVFRAPIDEREFFAWRMALRVLGEADLAAHPGCIPFFSPGFSAARWVNPRSSALEVLNRFKASN